MLGWCLPPQCVLCHGRGQPPTLDLCAACEDDLPVHPRPCIRCALPAGRGPDFSECARCRADPPPYDRCHAAFRYGFPLDGLVQGLKYDGQLANARVLGTLLGRSVQRAALHLDVDVLVPVPLHPDKLAERGFNQSIEIARWVAREVGRPCDCASLRRTRATRPQVGLPLAERLENLQQRIRRDRLVAWPSSRATRRRRHDRQHRAGMRVGAAARRGRHRRRLVRGAYADVKRVHSPRHAAETGPAWRSMTTSSRSRRCASS